MYYPSRSICYKISIKEYPFAIIKQSLVNSLTSKINGNQFLEEFLYVAEIPVETNPGKIMYP